MWKENAGKLAKIPLVRLGIYAAIRLLVPRQRVGVALVALNKANEVFMLRHVFHPYYEWGLPGGWLKRDEAPAAGVLRELKEETGLTAVLDSVIAVSHDTQPAHIGIAYAARLAPGSLQLSHEIREARWFPAHALPQPISRQTHQAIHAALAYQQVRSAEVRSFSQMTSD